MANEGSVPIFISSVHYGLEDLRGELCRFIEEDLGATAYISSEGGFPDQPDMPPYAQCLKVLEDCLITIGIIDRRYGQRFDEWGDYTQYKGLSPTHAELRHAITEKKRLFIFVREDVYSYYDIYRNNKDDFSNLSLPPRLDVRSLELLAEIKRHKPAPWIEGFKDIRDIKKSFQKRLLSDLAQALKEKEKIALECMERTISPQEHQVDTFDAIDPTASDDQITVGKVGIDINALKQMANRGQATQVAQYFTLVREGLILAKHIFEGIKRPLYSNSENERDEGFYIYTWKPSKDAIWNSETNTVEHVPAPRKTVFTVIVKADDAHPDLIGMLQHWSWVLEDESLSEAPAEWNNRYNSKVFTANRA